MLLQCQMLLSMYDEKNIQIFLSQFPNFFNHFCHLILSIKELPTQWIWLSNQPNHAMKRIYHQTNSYSYCSFKYVLQLGPNSNGSKSFQMTMYKFSYTYDWSKSCLTSAFLESLSLSCFYMINVFWCSMNILSNLETCTKYSFIP